MFIPVNVTEVELSSIQPGVQQGTTFKTYLDNGAVSMNRVVHVWAGIHMHS